MNDFSLEKTNGWKLFKNKIQDLIAKIKFMLPYINRMSDNSPARVTYGWFVDSCLIDLYWIAEYLKVKDMPNVDNPFYIWSKMFDTLKHFDRTSYLDEKIHENIKLEVDPNGKPFVRDIKEFYKLLKSKRDANCDDKTFSELCFKFYQPIFIDSSGWNGYGINDAHELTKQLAVIFWEVIINFLYFIFSYPSSKENPSLWKDFTNSRFYNNKIEEVWKSYESILEKIKNIGSK